MSDFLMQFEKKLEDITYNEKKSINLCEELLNVSTKMAITALEIAIDFAVNNELKYAYGYFNYFMAKALIEGASEEDVLVYANEAYSTFEEIGSEDEVIMVMNIFLVYYMKKEELEKCLEWAITALDLAEIIGNQERISMIKLNLANLYRLMGEYKGARDIYIEVEKLDISVSKEDKNGMFVGRAICEAELNDFQEANKYLDIANNLSDKSEVDIAEILYVEAMILFKEEVFVEAEEKILKAMALLEKLCVKSSIQEQSLLLSKIYLKQNKVNEAIKVLLSIEKYAMKRNKKNILIEIYELLEEGYKSEEDYKNAYNYASKLSKLEKEVLRQNDNRERAILKRRKEEDEEKTYKLLYKQTEMLYGIGNKITSNLNKANIFNIIANEIQNIINYDVVQIVTYSDKKKRFVYDVAIEQDFDINLNELEIKDDTIIAYCIRNKEDILINNIENEYSKYIDNYDEYDKYRKQRCGAETNITDKGAKSAIFIPIVIDERLIGVVSVQSYKCNAYDLKDLTTLKILSTYIGIALENSKLYQMMKYTATHDYLTGLLNRRETISRSETLYNNLDDTKENLVVTIIDIDNFKSINDTFGHITGDRVIELIGQSIKESLREDAIVGRYGGEEFIAIFKSTPFIKAQIIGETMRKNIEDLKFENSNGDVVKTTASIGMVEATNKSKNFSEIIGQADKAMYNGKNSGKNKLVYQKI